MSDEIADYLEERHKAFGSAKVKEGMKEYARRSKRGFRTLEKRKPVPRKIVQEKLAAQKGRCYLCNKPITLKQAEGEHISPYSRGGQTTEENSAAACKDCNLKKTDLEPLQTAKRFNRSLVEIYSAAQGEENE